MLKRLSLVLLIALLVASLAACGQTAAPEVEVPEEEEAEASAPAEDESLRVALILESVITDAGWNAAGYEGLMSAAEQVPGVEVAYSEKIASPDWIATARDYASQDFDVVLMHHGWMSDAAKEVAPEFPDTLFVVSNSGIMGPNYSGLDTKNEESGYMAGYIAGTVTETKKVGTIMAYEDVLPFRRGTQGFELGVEAACPDCEVLKAYVGSSEDIAGGKEAALAMYDADVDVIWQYADASGLGVIEAAEETGNMVIGSGVDQLELGTNSVVTTTVQSLGPVILDVIQGVKNGTFVADEPHLYGYDNEAYSLGELNMELLTQEQADAILAVRDQLVNGEIELPHIAD